MRFCIMGLFVAVTSCGSDDGAVGHLSDAFTSSDDSQVTENEDSSPDSYATVMDVFDDGDGNSTIVVTHVISPCVLLDPVDLYFGSVAFHDSELRWYVVQNTCTYDVELFPGDVRRKDSDEINSDFKFGKTKSILIPPGKDGNFVIQFQPEANEFGNLEVRYARAQFAISEHTEPEKYHSWALGNVTIALKGEAYKPDPPIAVIYAYRDPDFTDEVGSGDLVAINTPLYFDGQRSYSPEKQNGTFTGIHWYNWKLETPEDAAGVAAHLLPTDESATPHLVPDRCGVYQVSLVVGDWLWFNEPPALFTFEVSCE